MRASISAALFIALGQPSSGIQLGSQRAEPAEIDGQGEPRELHDIFMRYMPQRNLVVCGCAKCGTSSVYNYIYEKEFGHSWEFNDEPYIHEVDSDRWAGKWQVVDDVQKQHELMGSTYSVAFIRDPKERLVSAWKSKIACGGWYHTDYDTREWMSSELAKLAQWEYQDAECMELNGFLTALAMVHRQNKSHLLDRHFLPQTEGCFYNAKPTEWTHLVEIDLPGAFQALSSQFNDPDSAGPPSEHSSTAKVQITDEDMALLNEVTQAEYNMLSQYLSRDSRVKSDVWALVGDRDKPSLDK